MGFMAGDVVELSPSAKMHNVEPEKYRRGVVTNALGSWGIYDVKWNGIDHPIGMRHDEIVLVKDGANG